MNTFSPPPTVHTHIFDVPNVVETFHITLHILQPFILADANHNNRLLVDILQLLQTLRLVDIFHNSLCMFLLLVDTLHLPGYSRYLPQQPVPLACGYPQSPYGMEHSPQQPMPFPGYPPPHSSSYGSGYFPMNVPPASPFQGK